MWGFVEDKLQARRGAVERDNGLQLLGYMVYMKDFLGGDFNLHLGKCKLTEKFYIIIFLLCMPRKTHGGSKSQCKFYYNESRAVIRLH